MITNVDLKDPWLLRPGNVSPLPKKKKRILFCAENTGLVNNLNSVNISKNVLKTLSSHIIRIVGTCGG